ncbi:hypothetical protein ACFSLT_01450 [Novosphingobium resinovorum]
MAVTVFYKDDVIARGQPGISPRRYAISVRSPAAAICSPSTTIPGGRSIST